MNCKKSNPGVLKCTSDKTYANAKWTCSYMCGPSPYPFWAGGTDYWGKEGEHVSEYKDLTQAAAIIESRQFFYWRGCNPKGHNMKTPCGFVDGHAKMFNVLRPRELYRDPNQGDDWVVGCGVGPCDAAGNNSWGETSQYWNPQVLYEYYWK